MANELIPGEIIWISKWNFWISEIGEISNNNYILTKPHLSGHRPNGDNLPVYGITDINFKFNKP